MVSTVSTHETLDILLLRLRTMQQYSFYTSMQSMYVLTAIIRNIYLKIINSNVIFYGKNCQSMLCMWGRGWNQPGNI